MFKKFLQIFQFRINILIELVRTTLIRFISQRKTALTFVAESQFGFDPGENEPNGW
jgi:hypothetical protein